MGLEGWLGDVGRGPRVEGLENLQSQVGIEWVREALKRTGTATLRRRKLSHEAVVWLVIGIALFRNYSIELVVKHLELAEPSESPRRGRASGSPVSSSAIANARARVGPEPLVELHAMTSESWVAECDEQNRWKGLRLYAVDGSSLRIADTTSNEEVYGRPGSSRGEAGYPQARVVGLLAVGSRLLADVVVGSWHQGEVTLARMLLGNVPSQSLLILDRGFVDHGLFARIRACEDDRFFLCRAKAGSTPTVVRKLAKNDDLVELRVTPAQRRDDPSLPATVVVRRIGYRIPGFRPAQLYTSLLDPEMYPATEIVELYHRRWEIELAYDEIKTHTLEREETIRSRTPDGVLQEIYGLVIAYNLVRVMMARAAATAGVAPCRMSFRNSLLEIRVFFLAMAHETPGAIPRHYKRLSAELALLVLPERRHRSFLRAVKIKMTRFKRKNPK